MVLVTKQTLENTEEVGVDLHPKRDKGCRRNADRAGHLGSRLVGSDFGAPISDPQFSKRCPAFDVRFSCQDFVRCLCVSYDCFSTPQH